MTETTHTIKGGIIIDLHYLLAIVPVRGTCFVDLHYQLLPKPARLEIGNSTGMFLREEAEKEIAAIETAWKNYKQKQNR